MNAALEHYYVHDGQPQPPEIGCRVMLPDSGEVTVTAVTTGVEYGDPVWYVTGRNSLGQFVTRWVRRPARSVAEAMMQTPEFDHFGLNP